MSYIYEISTGRMLDTSSSEEKLFTVAWAGHDTDVVKGFNNPDAISVKGIGPLPPGVYAIGDPIHHPHLGELSFPLFPDAHNTMFGRKGFFIHGSSKENPIMSSDGCIIAFRYFREKLAKAIEGSSMGSPKRYLRVVL